MPPHTAGFTLVETIVAAALVASAVVVLAQLVALGAEQSASNRHALRAMIAAQSKLEELRALAWTFAPDGTPLSDAGLSPSPPGSLFESTTGYTEYLDDAGLLRRWGIQPLVPADSDTLILQVCVYRAASAASAHRQPEACVSAVRTRKP